MPQVGDLVHCVVEKVTKYGAFVRVGPASAGLMHISAISKQRIKEVSEVFEIGEQIKVCGIIHITSQ